MSMKITDTVMTSDQTPHKATAGPVANGQQFWTVTWLPGRQLTRNEAITAMILAETVAAGLGDHTDPQWLHIDGWAAELGLHGTDAVGKVSYHAYAAASRQDTESGER